MKLPEDPMMLYSFINMKLRDFYPSLDALCEDMNVEKEVIVRQHDLVKSHTLYLLEKRKEKRWKLAS